MSIKYKFFYLPRFLRTREQFRLPQKCCLYALNLILVFSERSEKARQSGEASNENILRYCRWLSRLPILLRTKTFMYRRELRDDFEVVSLLVSRYDELDDVIAWNVRFCRDQSECWGIWNVWLILTRLSRTQLVKPQKSFWSFWRFAVAYDQRGMIIASNFIVKLSVLLLTMTILAKSSQTRHFHTSMRWASNRTRTFPVTFPQNLPFVRKTSSRRRKTFLCVLEHEK